MYNIIRCRLLQGGNRTHTRADRRKSIPGGDCDAQSHTTAVGNKTTTDPAGYF